MDEEITHICLLNSDVIVSDYWIDRLLEKEFDIISCVTMTFQKKNVLQVIIVKNGLAEPTYFPTSGITFFPGGFEDDDYCIRSKSLGFSKRCIIGHQFFSDRAYLERPFLLIQKVYLKLYVQSLNALIEHSF